MSIDSINASPVIAPTDPTSAKPMATGKGKALGQDDFLKLLITQFQAQDPMKPMDDTAFIAQMAQFSSLQQTQTLTQQMTQMLSNQDLATANSYIGRQAVVDAGNGKTQTGVVSSVEIISGKPRVVIGDFSYPVASVLSVAPAPVVTTPTVMTPTLPAPSDSPSS